MELGNRKGWRLLSLGAAAIALALASACGSDGDGEDPVVGSGTLDDREVEAMFVESVVIELPFRATVYDGARRVLRIRGEDNLIDLIEVEETEVGAWTISAPDVDFEQHEDISIQIPFIDMVEISLLGADLDFGDDPTTVWADDEEEEADAGAQSGLEESAGG